MVVLLVVAMKVLVVVVAMKVLVAVEVEGGDVVVSASLEWKCR